ncbi:MAG: enoyl-CoA hydratase [Kiloniellales bacterium]|nr:enoyl-CoA hydratase [Kiloniellales bacterium]
MSFENLRVERRGNVGIVTLDRPEVLNALSEDLMSELSEAVDGLDADPEIRCLVLTGSDKAFAAGANIKDMVDKTYAEVLRDDFISGSWTRLARCRTPVVAAVAGYAIGGGCELAMMCDIVIAAETARFGQPEITIGTIPAAGGTQRLPRLIGKAKAMELCLTGRMMDAGEAERAGLVSRVVPAEALMEEALQTAETVAAMPEQAARMVKEAINAAFEMPLSQGLRFEGRLFHSTFATEDRREGMAAFVEKRQPVWRHR